MKSLCTAALVLACLAAQRAPANDSTSDYYAPAPTLLPVSAAPAIDARPNPTILSAITPSLPTRPISTTKGDEAKSVYMDSAAGGWGDEPSCGQQATCGCGCDCCCPKWFGYAGGLIMTRDNPNKKWTTFETNNNPNQLLNTQDARDSWAGGAEIRIGHTIGCGCCGGCPTQAWEATYWGVYGMNGEAEIYDPTNHLSTPIDTGNGVLINGNSASSYFDSAREHRITRDDTFHNVELNWLLTTTTSNSNLDIQWLCGVRYFNFSENLSFGSLAGTAPVGAHLGDDPAEEAYLDIHVDNNLYGFQVGARADYQMSRCHAFITPKFGIFGNHVTGRSTLHDGNGVQGFDISGSADRVSFLGQIDLGMTYDITCHWSVTGGYRVVAISGVGLADNQIPAFLAAADEFADIDTNGDLILHGAFAGVECHW